MSTTILRLPAVKARTGLSRSTIYQRVADGDFPRPVPLGPRAVGWLAHEVEAWIDTRVAQRPTGGAWTGAAGNPAAEKPRRNNNGNDLDLRSPRSAVKRRHHNQRSHP